MKVDFIIPCRNKRAWVGRAMRSAIYQEHPCRVIVSDQGSTDGSLEEIKRVAAAENGNPVEVLQCPETHYKGMPGFNLHLNWLHTQIDGDIVIVCSADDYVLPGRVADTVAAFEENDCDFVLTCNRFEEAFGECYGYSPKEHSGFVGFAELVHTKLGGSAAQNWTRKFWNEVGGMPLFPGCDMLLPHIAAARGRCYYVANPTHVYVRHVDPNNTGLESVALAAKPQDALAVAELMAFHRMTGLYEFGARGMKFDRPEDHEAFMNDLMTVVVEWTQIRMQMTAQGIECKQFPMLLPAEPDGAPSVVNP